MNKHANKQSKKKITKNNLKEKPKITLRELASQELEQIISKIETTYDTSFKITPTRLYINSKNKIYFSTITQFPPNLSRINGIGLYIATLLDTGEIRLSIEGTQLLQTPKQNYVILKDKFISSYVSGENLFFDEIEKESEIQTAPFQIVLTSSKESIGVISKKEKYYLNYLSKGRKMDFNKVF
ncbi:MAG: hypothetical protein ACMXYB_02665 [Candidatus Woesearchaeota archaeon]